MKLYLTATRQELDFNHNYFRDLPTLDPQLIGTGLLDEHLFQALALALGSKW